MRVYVMSHDNLRYDDSVCFTGPTANSENIRIRFLSVLKIWTLRQTVGRIRNYCNFAIYKKAK